MRKIILILFAFVLLNISAHAQITGTISGKDFTGETVVLPKANIYWSNFEKGTTSDMQGHYEIAEPPSGIFIIASYVGYKSDTIKSFENKKIDILLVESTLLSQIEVVANSSNSHIDRMNPLWNQEVGSGELQRAACCNLSESFETNASVDINYTDAVSGAKQISMLGLAGIYSQLLVENIPFMRGLGSSFGLEFIPGTWMNSISISKGNSAVINGYESITGQINAELKKPEAKEKFFFNYYINDVGKHEFNMNASADLNKNVSTIVLGHFSFNNAKIDNNKDGFMDINTGRQINIANFWQLFNSKGLEMRWGVRAIDESRNGGQISGSPYFQISPEGLWTSKINNQRGEAFLKSGYVFKNKPGASVGFINSFSIHKIDMLLGKKTYDGLQKSFYSNLIYHSPFKNHRHSYDAGFNIVYDDVSETLNQIKKQQKEFVPGLFFQYTYNIPEKLTLMLGLREDYNSRWGFLTTPRLHAKYHINKSTTLRGSIGIGHRSPYMIPENISILTSSRDIVFLNEPEMEHALNYCITLVKNIDIRGKELMISLEYFKTDFLNQMLIDMETDTSNIYIYSLNGKSYSHNAQIEVSYPLHKHLEIRAAMRYNDVRQTLLNQKLEVKPLVSNYKGLLTLSFVSNMKRWQADITSQFIGKSRLPDRSAFPLPYQLDKYSPEHIIIHSQITRNFKHWSIYAGVENLTNFTQPKPILSADKPYSPYFDSGIIWGPVMGRKIYAGIKIKFNKK